MGELEDYSLIVIWFAQSVFCLILVSDVFMLQT